MTINLDTTSPPGNNNNIGAGINIINLSYKLKLFIKSQVF